MLHINNLSVCFTDKRGGEAVHDVSLHMKKGETLGLVGESGSGKTVLALTIAGLIQRGRTSTRGEILLDGVNLMELPRDELRKKQGSEIGFIFQEPMTSLNPLMRVGRQVEETLLLHTDLPKEFRREMAVEVMRQVDLPQPEKIYEKYPHQLSGGQRQRVVIASAIISRPKLLIADEPTTALDMEVQGQIIELLRRINKSWDMGILFISHDLGVVKKLCQRVAVMYKGVIVESGRTQEIFENPSHDYTKSLIKAIPTRENRIQ